jgi:hypothetical protein
MQILAGVGAPATGDYNSISTTTVGVGGVATVTFSAIPATYSHLQIRFMAQTNRATVGRDGILVRLNSDTASNYSYHELAGDGASATSSSSLTTYLLSNAISTGTTTGSNWGGGILDILDYANTNKYKTARCLSGTDCNGTVGGLGGAIVLSSGNWRSTSAINAISITMNGGTLFSQYSSFALYGIKG